MSSQIPALLDEIENRLKTIAGAVNVYRALQGRAYPNDGSLPAIAVRIATDTLESAQSGKARVHVALDIEWMMTADNAFSDAALAGRIWDIRHALGVDENPPLNGLLRAGTGIEWGPAVYGYPDPGSLLAIARQPITLHLIETY